MKKSILIFSALLSFAAVSAHANWLGYPSFEEMNKVTIQKVQQIVAAKNLVAVPFAIQTKKLNNIYVLTQKNGCQFQATVDWSEYGWPYIDGVAVKSLNCF